MTDELEQLRARVKELEEAVADFHSAARPVSVASELRAQLTAANADRARLREALKCHEAIVPGDYGCLAETPFDLCPACAALTSTDASEWLRERERRVAERAWRKGESHGFTLGLTLDERTPAELDDVAAMHRDIDALLKEET